MSNIINILTIFFSHFFYIVISYIFPENFSEIHQLSKEFKDINVYLNFNYFHQLTFTCYKKTNDVSIYRIISAVF